MYMYGNSVSFTYECPETKNEVTISGGALSIDGGCSGHYGEYDYCYCDSAHLEVSCTECKHLHEFYL